MKRKRQQKKLQTDTQRFITEEIEMPRVVFVFGDERKRRRG
jgi:hypothetical protein